jgi:NAD(P)-dependent dehydrogenase (short-subunit alcohol dehydrogenase family)
MFKDKIAVITGGAAGIGKCICEAFEKAGAKVYTIDIEENSCFTGDISNETDLIKFSELVISENGKIDYLINNAKPLTKGLDSCTWQEFNYALRVGVSAPFFLTKLFVPYFNPGGAIVNISSSRDRMSQPFTESYTAAKGGIAALTHAMAASLSGKVRVNSISPGWIDTTGSDWPVEDMSQHFAGRVGRPEDIANMVLFLCSDKAGFITGENICIDGGMTKNMIYHGDLGWKLSAE